MPDDVRITVRLGHDQADTLDRLASGEGISRSLMVRRLIEAQGDSASSTSRLSRDDLIALLEERARTGSAPAIRELLRRHEQEAEDALLRELTTDG